MGVFTVTSDELLRLFGAERSMKRLILAINVMLGLLLGYQLAILMGFEAEEHKMVVPERDASLDRPAVPIADGVSSMSLEQVHVFGEPQAAIRQETVTEAPEVRPTLTLRGIIHSTNKRAARAIITESSGRDVAYPLGARLPGGMRLTEINYRDVVISHRGRQELLHLSNRAAPGT